ncbi:MAG TPA: PLP-dependent aminotransferase family protein [Opitutaceae bacterium]|nr:PLP-dependent aminotransferase family protein [Opitutaceae bacterium]
MHASSSSHVSFSALGRRAHPPTIARLMTMALETPGLLSLAAGFTDNQTLPTSFVRDIVERLTSAADKEYLQYGTNQGRIGLRRVLAERIQRMELELDPGQLAESTLITNGSQQALYLAIQVLCDPGDIVLVDRPSYFVFLEMLTGLGVSARSIPVDSAGKVDRAVFGHLLDGMKASGDADRLRAVYFVSHFSNPSGRSLSDSEKTDIAEALRDRDMTVPVIEDAAYRELYFTAPFESQSILSAPAWRDFPKFYTSTLTKPFATGLKVGFGVCSDRDWLNKMLYAKGHHDFGTANFNQAVLEQALQTGAFDQELKVVRAAYLKKRDALHQALLEQKLDQRGWSWALPTGGLYLWLRAPEGIDTGLEGEFCRACIANGVVYVPGELCFGDEPSRNFVRLSYGVLGEAALQEAGRRFGQVAQRFTP